MPLLTPLLLALLLPLFSGSSGADLPISFILLPDGPPYSLLDLPLLSSSPPYPQSIGIDEIPPNQRLQISVGNLFVRVPNDSPSWAYMQIDVQVRLRSHDLPALFSLIIFARSFKCACCWCLMRRLTSRAIHRTFLPPLDAFRHYVI